MDGDSKQNPRDTPRPTRMRLVAALVLLAFVGGLAVMAWVMTHWSSSGPWAQDSATAQPANNAAPADNGAAPADNADQPQSAPASATTASTAPANPNAPAQSDSNAASNTLETQVSALEQRLTRVAVAAQSASGYANRAEAIMIAFAARRALDSGAPLGYLEGQLRLLFSDAQPKAVATIVNAANEPVTINKLRAGLEDIDQTVEQGAPNEGWWAGFKRDMSTLAIIRPAGTPPPEPKQRIARARRDIESGQIDDAMREITALPPNPTITQWLEQARRYNEAHRALDVIEAAAILEPRAAPMVAAPKPATPNARP